MELTITSPENNRQSHSYIRDDIYNPTFLLWDVLSVHVKVIGTVSSTNFCALGCLKRPTPKIYTTVTISLKAQFLKMCHRQLCCVKGN